MALTDDELQFLSNEDPRAQAPDLRGTVDRASFRDPDKFAKVLDISEFRELPTDIVESELDEFQRRQHVESIDYSKFGPELTKFLRNPDNAVVAQDDHKTLQGIERELKPGSLTRQVREAGQELKNIGSSLAAGIYDIESGITGVAENVTDLIRHVTTKPLADAGILPGDPINPVSEWLRQHRGEAQAWAEFLTPEASNEIKAAVYGGLRSAGANIPMMAMSAGTGNAYHALGMMVGTVEGRSYGEAKDQGLDINSATLYAVTDSAIEYATEKIPAFKLLDDLGVGTPFFKTLARQIIAEVPGEQVATLLQDLNAWANLPSNRDKAFSEYIAERPSAALQTLISTVVGTSVQTGVTYSVGKLAGADGQVGTPEDDATVRRVNQLLSSTDDQARLDTLITLAQESTTNDRAQDRFKEFLSGAGSDQFVYVPADIVETLPVIPDYMSNQIDGLGGDVAIPMDLFMAEVAVSDDIMEVLRPHLRMGEDRLSATEIEQGGDTAVRALLERAQAAADIKTEADEIWETVKDQLQATGRATEAEARLSSQLYPAYATVKAEQLGISPREVFDRMGFSVVGPAGVPPAAAPVQVPSEAVLEQAAFHGSPHKFEQFSLDAIGTGEGAQAFGWGLYFAGKREVAEWYRKTLSATGAGIDARGTIERTFEGVEITEEAVANVIADFKKRAERTDNVEFIAKMEEAIELLESGFRPGGQLFQVDIPEDDVLLDYDKPLSDQGDKTQAVREITDELHGEGTFDNWTEVNEGGDYRDWKDNLMDSLSDQEISVALNDKGIPGLRYLDQDSRQGEEGTHNYVIWDANKVTIEAINDELRFAQEREDVTDEQAGRRAIDEDQAAEPGTYREATERTDEEAGAQFDRAKQGEQVTFVHRSSEDFAAFDDSLIGTNTTTPSAGLGHYLGAADVGNADRYGNNVSVFTMTLQNPLVVDAETFADTMADKTPEEVATMRQSFMDAGHDGVLINGLNHAIVFEADTLSKVPDEADEFLEREVPRDQKRREMLMKLKECLSNG